MISVPIPRVRQSSLEECLDLFREYEYLRGDERYLCSKCKQISEKRRRLDIWELPQIFIVHFKRYSIDFFLLIAFHSNTIILLFSVFAFNRIIILKTRL